MASKSLNLLLISALGAMAIGIVAYNGGALDSYLPRGAADEPAAAAGAAPGDEVAAVDTNQAAGDAQKAGDDEAGATATDTGEAGTDEAGGAEAAPPAGVVAPRFDVVRVEPDGNVIIAGNAAADATVEVVTGSRVLGETTAGAGGDFAVVLSDPLKPGDHTVVLRATTPDKVVAMSAETAIVSIPETSAGEVLAIVDEPGKPSKLITVPEGEKTAGADEAEDAGETTDVAMSAGDVAEDADEAAKTGETAKAGNDAADAVGAGEEIAAAGMDEAMDEAGSAADADKVADDGSDPVDSDSAEETTEMAAVDPAAGAAGEEDADEAVVAGEASEPATTEPAAELRVAVEAVEIEGDHVFIAGVANPGKIVRVYANKDLVGEATVSEIGRFLVESTRGLPVGDYIIRADLLNVGSADVIARAAVPFEREAGEMVAAVAPQVGGESVSDEGGSVDDAAADTANGGAVADGEETVTAEASESVEIQSGAEAGDTTGKSETAQAEDKPAEDAAGDAAQAAEDTGGEAADMAAEETGEPAKPEPATDMAKAGGKDTATGEKTEGSDQVAMAADADTGVNAADTVNAGEAADDSGNAGNDPGEEALEQAAAGEAVGTDEAAETTEPGSIEFAKFGEDVAVTAPKLEKASGSVIIRRGDTLWRISRRVYGRGIRYTTIYTANRDQIKNPHRIWPGQVFGVPGVSEDGTEADMDAIADQMAKPEDESRTQ